MGRREVTLADIAKLANVSTSTVSRVLNYDETLNVQAETRKKVFNAAEELSYKVENKKNIKYTLGFYFGIPTLMETEDVFYQDLRLEIETLLKIKGIGFRLISREETPKSVKDISGIISLGLFTEKNELEWLEKLDKPLVFVDSNPNPDKYCSVEFDLSYSTEKVLNYLTDLGHSRIGFIGGRDESSDGTRFLNYTDDRENAYRNFMLKKNLLIEDHIRIGKFTPESGYKNFTEIFSQDVPPTALFVANDSLVVGCYRAAYEMGFSIPEDVSLIGFNDIDSAKYLIPSLSTVRLNMKEMAELSVKMMKDILNGFNFPVRMIIPNKLIIRDSAKTLIESE